MTSLSKSDAEIVLADRPVFRLGRLEVSPSLRQIRFALECRSVEPRVMQVFALLAEARGRTVSRDELVARCWGGRSVGEDAINRIISHVRRLATLDPQGSFLVETIPRVGYLLREIEAAPDPVPDRAAGPGPQPSVDIPVEAIAASPDPRRRAVVMGLGLGAVALCGAGAGWLRMSGGKRPRIAVLPFDADLPAQRELADGLVDTLIDALAGVSGIDVVARSSSFALRGSRKADAATLLGVTHLIDGAVRQIGAAETAVISLIEARTETILWSQHYPIAPESIAMLNARIVRDTTAMTRLSAAPPAAGIDAAAYRLFLNGRGMLLQDPPRPEEAISQFKLVTSSAPGFSPGWSGLASAWLAAQGPIGAAGHQLATARSAARDAARRAVATDGTNADAYVQSATAMDRAGNWAGIERLLALALAREPGNPEALYRAGAFYADVGWNDRAIELLRRAWAVDPLNGDAAFLLLRVLEAAGRETELETFLANVRGQWPDNVAIWRFAACRASWLRRYDEVQRLVRTVPAGAEDEAGYFADLIACLRDPAAPRRQRFLAPVAGPLPAFWPTSIFALAMIGEAAACLALVRRIYLSPNGLAQAPSWVLLQSMMRPLRTAPEIQDVLRRLGLSDFWRARGGSPISA